MPRKTLYTHNIPKSTIKKTLDIRSFLRGLEKAKEAPTVVFMERLANKLNIPLKNFQVQSVVVTQAIESKLRYLDRKWLMRNYSYLSKRQIDVQVGMLAFYGPLATHSDWAVDSKVYIRKFGGE